MTQPRNTHPEDLKAAIRKAGKTMDGLSVDLGYAPCAVGMAIRRRWHEVRVGISEFLGQPLQQLWPEDYFPDGTPRHHRPRSESSRAARLSRRTKSSQGLTL